LAFSASASNCVVVGTDFDLNVVNVHGDFVPDIVVVELAEPGGVGSNGRLMGLYLFLLFS
jgi:hypothetical protein